MTWIWKSAVVAAVLALAGIVGLREFGTSTSPEKTESHEHGAEKGHGEGGPAGEGQGHDKVAKAEGAGEESGHAHGDSGAEEHGAEGLVKLTPSQLAASGIEMAPAASGTRSDTILLTGRLV